MWLTEWEESWDKGVRSSHIFCWGQMRACAFGVLLCGRVPLLAAVPCPPALRRLREVSRAPLLRLARRAEEEPRRSGLLPEQCPLVRTLLPNTICR